jgi:SOS-response transcriptional repressor LexA
LPLKPATLEPYVNAVPLYDLAAAAGDFSRQQQAKPTDWVRVPEGMRIDEGYFACRVLGESMNRVIPNGSTCLFRRDPGGTRNGKIVLVEHSDVIDEDSGCHYTVKEYESVKSEQGDEWSHNTIYLKPRSTDPSFEPLVLTEAASRYQVVGLFIQVLM